MVSNMRNAATKHWRQANQDRFRSGDLEEPTLSSADRYFPIWKETGTNTRTFAGGYGSDNRDLAQGWADLDLQSDTPANIDGTARWAIYSDEQLDDPLFYSDSYSLEDLRASEPADRTDKTLMPGKIPAAGDDRVLVFEVSPATNSVGDTVSAADSAVDVGIPFSQFR